MGAQQRASRWHRTCTLFLGRIWQVPKCTFPFLSLPIPLLPPSFFHLVIFVVPLVHSLRIEKVKALFSQRPNPRGDRRSMNSTGMRNQHFARDGKR